MTLDGHRSSSPFESLGKVFCPNLDLAVGGDGQRCSSIFCLFHLRTTTKRRTGNCHRIATPIRTKQIQISSSIREQWPMFHLYSNWNYATDQKVIVQGDTGEHNLHISLHISPLICHLHWIVQMNKFSFIVGCCERDLSLSRVARWQSSFLNVFSRVWRDARQLIEHISDGDGRCCSSPASLFPFCQRSFSEKSELNWYSIVATKQLFKSSELNGEKIALHPVENVFSWWREEESSFCLSEKSVSLQLLMVKQMSEKRCRVKSSELREKCCLTSRRDLCPKIFTHRDISNTNEQMHKTRSLKGNLCFVQCHSRLCLWQIVFTTEKNLLLSRLFSSIPSFSATEICSVSMWRRDCFVRDWLLLYNWMHWKAAGSVSRLTETLFNINQLFVKFVALFCHWCVVESVALDNWSEGAFRFW